MILILSSSSDPHIDPVITWLKHYKRKYIRINADEVLGNNFYLSLLDKVFIVAGKRVDVNEINIIWYRKFGGFSKTGYYKEVQNKINSLDIQQLSKEYNKTLNAIISLLKHKKWITPPWLSSVNKINMISLANEFGMNTPKSWVISTKKRLTRICNEFEVISKSIHEPLFIRVENGFYSMFTKQIKDVDAYPENFYPSLVQEKISKEYEIRIFYIEGKFYSMAIFSQASKMSEMDFRRYDFTNPTRRTPYNLPLETKDKLHKMLSKMKLNCCSIDLIKSAKDGLYYFLEVNPTGAFGMVSIPCNYEIYKTIAETLINKNDNEKI